MGLEYGFYNSVNQDRQYDSLQLSAIFDGLITDGVYETYKDRLMVSEGGGMNVLVGTGRAWFNHTWTNLDTPLYLLISPAHPILKRIDVVFLEVNTNTDVRANRIGIISGEFSLTPVIPDLTNTETIFQYPLAIITVNPAVTSITAGDIENRVGTLDCPFVLCPVTHITTSELLAQWEAQWETWFNAIKGQLSEEAETNLYNMITALREDVETATYDKQLYIPASQFVLRDSEMSFLDLGFDGRVAQFPPSYITVASCGFGLPRDMDNAYPVKFSIVYYSLSSGAWVVMLDMLTFYPGKTVDTSHPGFLFHTCPLPTRDTITVETIGEFQYPVDPADYPGGLLANLFVSRRGTDSEDENVNSIRVYGVIIEYVSKPTSR